MVWNVFNFSKGTLSLEEMLKEANLQLDTAIAVANPNKQILACNNANTLIKKAGKQYNSDKVKNKGQDLNVAEAYNKLAITLDRLDYREKAARSHTKAKAWGYLATGASSNNVEGISDLNTKNVNQVSPLIVTPSGDNTRSTLVTHTTQTQSQSRKQIFYQNSLPAPTYSLPESGERITSTLQLAYYLAVLQSSFATNPTFGIVEKQIVTADPAELKRAQRIATRVIQTFIEDGIKRSDAVAEVVYLAAVLNKEESEILLNVFVNEINRSIILKENLVNGLSHLIRNAPSGFINSDSLVKILKLLSTRLQETHHKSNKHVYRLAQAISNILDSMVDSQVEGLNRDQLRAPLLEYLKTLQSSPDPFLSYQAAYAYQAIQYISDDESFLHEALRRTGNVVHGLSGVISSVKSINISGFITGLMQIRDGLSNEGNDKFGAEESAENFRKNRETLLTSSQDGVYLSREWYPALRGLDALLKEGRLADFERLAREAPCKNDLEFQWGLCQRLGELVIDERWDGNVRQDAISFIEELFADSINWNLHSTVKQFLFYFLKNLDKSTSDKISTQIYRVIKDLDQNNQDATSPVSLKDREDYVLSFTMIVMTPPRSSPLLQKVLSTPDVGPTLLQLMRNRVDDSTIDIYISPRAKAHPRATEDFDLTTKIQEFIKGEKKVFLILGDSGSGKSTFSRALEMDLWKSYKKDKKLIPLYVHIPTIENPERNIIEKYLSRHHFTDDEISELKLSREFILICDGYDESNLTRNLYVSNNLNQGGDWKVKMIIGCRSDYCDDRTMFHPSDHGDRRAARLFEEATIISFNKDQIQEYVAEYVTKFSSTWQAEDYLLAIKEIPNLHDLVSNPFILKIALEVLPDMHISKAKYSTTQVTRVGLYDKFVIQWLNRNRIRLSDMEKSEEDELNLSEILRTGFQKHGLVYLKELATAIYDKQNGNSVVSYSSIRDQKSWKEEFFKVGGRKSYMSQAVPLFRNGDYYRFIHKSVLEYAFTLAIFDPNEPDSTTEELEESAKNDGEGSNLDSDLDSLSDINITTQQPPLESPIESSLESTPLGRRIIVKSHSIRGFLAERVQQYPKFKLRLLKAIESSKKNRNASVLAANSITVLVTAGVQFNGADLREVKIPGADLSGGVFDSATLEGADLRKVYLRNTWLRQATLDRSNMSGVKFGEVPYIQEENSVGFCARSPDGDILAAGLSNGTINIYEMQTCLKISTLIGHEAVVSGVAFSHLSTHLVSGSMDMSIRVWNIKTGECIQTLHGHNLWVNSVAFSPVNNLIAAGGIDTIIRVWNETTGDCLINLEGHTDSVNSVTFSPTGNHIASGSGDNSIRIWNTESGECVNILSGHDDGILRVLYSPLGDRIISGSGDKTIRIWDTATGNCIHTLHGHGHAVSSLDYSLDGERIASGSFDNAVRLWDAESGNCVNILQGHSNIIAGVVFTKQGKYIISGSQDKTLRMWDIKDGYYTDTLKGHHNDVYSVLHSPAGDLIASGSYDDTARVWDTNTGVCVQTFRGRGNTYNGFAYSPQGDRIACGSKEVIHVWNIKSGKSDLLLRGHSSQVCHTVYSPKGDLIASASRDKTSRVWDATTGKCLHVLDHESDVYSIMFSPQGNRIATGCLDGTVRVWDIKSADCLRIFQAHVGNVNSVIFSPLRGDHLISAGDKTIRVWNTETGDCIHIMSGHELRVDHFVYSPNGELIASASNDQTVRIWDVKSGNCIRTLQGHENFIRSVAFSPLGNRIASGSNDNTVRIWDVDSGKCLAVISSFNEDVYSVDWGKDTTEDYVVTGSGDKSVRRWKLISENEQVKAVLSWSSSHEGIVAKDATFKGIVGLSPIDIALLTQRGAQVQE